MTNQVYVSDLQKILTYITALFLILNVGCVYTHMDGSGHLDGIITFFPAVLMVVMLFLKRTYPKNKMDYAAKIVIFLLIYLTLFALLSGSNFRNTIAEIALVAVFAAYYILVEKDSRPNIIIAYRDIIFVIAIISFFFWLFGSILGVINPSGTVVSNWGVSGGGQYNSLKSYFMLHFELDRTYIFGRWIVCNRSIFVERAFAAFAFSIGWLYELFIEKQKSKVRLIVFFAVMISTFSMAALIITVLTTMLYYIFNGTNKKILNFMRAVLIPVVVFFAWLAVRYILDVKFSMGHSGTSRLSDFRNGFAAWKLSPIWGYGYGNSGYIHSQYRTGYSNAITMVLTQGGIMLAILYLVPIIKGIRIGIIQREINYSLFVVVIILETIFTAIAFTNIMIYLLLYFACGYIVEKSNQKMQFEC